MQARRLPDSRIFAPPMPAASCEHLTHADAMAIAAYLKALPPDKYVPTRPGRTDNK